MDSLFDSEAAQEQPARKDTASAGDAPLAARLRPASLDDFVGQRHLLGEGSALRTAIEQGRPHS
ncbi:MAG: replication-associated recombination protein A, partial [Solirubrobacteraceae bacterium]